MGRHFRNRGKIVNFESGKFYQHAGGRYIAVVGEVKTYKRGDMLVIEEADRTGHAISCIEKNEERNENWIEVGKAEWVRNFEDA